MFTVFSVWFGVVIGESGPCSSDMHFCVMNDLSVDF